ncbi:MAG: homocysteine S-methyltransferase family protein [Solirubrobacterales bacterium]
MSQSERDILAAVRERIIVFDGGMGATLERFDLSSEDYGGLPGRCHEALVLHRPDVIAGVHESMLAAGAEVVETDSFQGSRLKLDEWGLGERTVEINRRAAEIARAAAGPERFVAGSIGPTGFLPASDDPTLGDISFARLVAVFDEQAGALVEGGVDLLIIETAQDILEVRAAIVGAREAFARVGRTVPIQASVSLLPNGGKMLLGTDIEAVLAILEGMRVDIVGLNCSTGPEDMRDAIRYLGEHSPLPVHCIPNAGLPLQGPDGETIFPETPEQIATVLGEFVERHGVGLVGGCCGTTPEHVAAIAERVRGIEPAPRPAPGPPRLASMMTAVDLVQEPRPTLVGERVNSQGSKRAKELLLADDYEGLVRVAEDQVEGGAHVLDVCVALTERQDEDAQMGETVSRISLSQPAPIQVDSTEPEVIEAALERIPGRAIVNSVNLEAGRAKLDRVVPIAIRHGAALIALTIDERGMAKTAERKLEVAREIHRLACDEHGLDPELLIFDALTFTLTTGDEEWRPSAVETIDGIRRIKAGLPGVKTSLGVSNVSFGISAGARAVLNSAFLHHCVEAGLDLAMVNPNHITPYAEIAAVERELADDLVLNRSDDALERFIAHFESKGPAEEEAESGDPTDGMEPEEALHFQILRRRKEGVEEWIDRSVDKIGAVPTLNDVLLPAMKEVGDKFGAGELILPFVLQSAEVMKRAVARLERYLDRIEGHTKGTVVIATVFGDVHDIGKSLVNTILTNNGYTVVDLGKQVPIEQIIDAAVDHEADAIGLSALLVSTSKQMPACIQELHQRELDFPVLIGGAAINRDFGRRALYPHGRESDEVYGPGVFYCKDAFVGLDTVDALVDDEAREALVTKIRDEARKLHEVPVERDDAPPTSDDSVRSAVSTTTPVPEVQLGVFDVDVDLDEVFPYLDRHVLFKLHWGGRGKKGEEWRRIVEGDGDEEGFRARLERMWAEQDYLEPRARIGYFPCNADGNELVVFDPADPERELERLVFPRQPRHDRICLADFFRPLADDPHPTQRDVVVLQAVTAGPEVTRRIEQLERDGEFAEQLFVHGLGVQSAEGMAEWLHARARATLGIDPSQGRRYSWGYPACPEQSEHEKVWRLLRLDELGMRLSSGWAVDPEQSTVAIVAHHPQAVYFGMKSGFVPDEPKPDELIAGTERGGELPPDGDVAGDGTVVAEVGEPAADAASA